MPVRTNAHQTQFPATPVRLTMSVTRLGVSALNVVATIERPASHHGTARPDSKNSEVLRPARRAKNSAGPKQIRSEAPTMNQSSAVRCIVGRVKSIRYRIGAHGTLSAADWTRPHRNDRLFAVDQPEGDPHADNRVGLRSSVPVRVNRA